MSRPPESVEALREVMRRLLREQSLRDLEAQSGVGRETLRKFIVGQTTPHPRTAELLQQWVRQLRQEHESLADTGRPARRNGPYLPDARKRIDELLASLAGAASGERNPSKNGGPDRFTLSVEFPEWLDEDTAADVLAELIIRLSAVHIALGGGGLELDGIEAGSPAHAHF